VRKWDRSGIRTEGNQRCESRPGRPGRLSCFWGRSIRVFSRVKLAAMNFNAVSNNLGPIVILIGAGLAFATQVGKTDGGSKIFWGTMLIGSFVVLGISVWHYTQIAYYCASIVQAAEEDDKYPTQKVHIAARRSSNQLVPALDPYVTLAVDVVNMTVYDMTVIGVEGKLHLEGEEMQQYPQLLERPYNMPPITIPHAGTDSITIKCFITPAAAVKAKQNGTEDLNATGLKLKLKYRNIHGDDKDTLVPVKEVLFN
jgi:hypothetical protein